MTIVRDVPENTSRCECGNCPSYPGESGLFCSRGRSATEIALKGCLCASCAVYKQYDLEGSYYCEEGAHGAHGEGPQ